MKILPSLKTLSPLKESYLTHGMDIVVVRDLQGGMLSGNHEKKIGNGGKTASDLEYYDKDMIAFTAKLAFQIADGRKKKVVSLDKSNVLASSLLWRQTVSEFAASQPQIQLTHQYIDNASMDVIRVPGAYDVILTSNVFGDILSDELTQLTGTPCFFGSAEIAADGRGLYTPNQLHHPREELAGQNIVHPFCILDALRLMLLYTFRLPDLAKRLENAACSIIQDRLTTPELPIPGFSQLSTDEMGDEMVKRVTENLLLFPT